MGSDPFHSGAPPALPLPRRRRLLLGACVSVATLLVLGVLFEIGARVLIPESTFRILSNVYAPDPDPRVGYTFKRSYRGPAFGTELATNSLGYRGAEWELAKPAGTLRLVLLGDSHAFGLGVPSAQTVGELLRERLEKRLRTRVEVLNFGVNGYNTLQERAVLESKALRYAPDVVLLLPCNNDADKAMWVDDEGYLHWDDRQAPVGEGGRILDRSQDAFARFQRTVRSKSRFLLWLRLRWYRYTVARATEKGAVAKGDPYASSAPWLGPVGTGPVPDELRAPVYEPLSRMIEAARAYGAKPVVLTFTDHPTWRAMLNALAAEARVPLLELVPLLGGVATYEQFQRKWSLGWDAHMGPAAQQVWAAAVEELLARVGIVQ